MTNQKGQAFSVFELMIAAIVAIAILFVLLPIIGGIITPTGNPKDVVGNALSSVPAGTSSETTPFVIERNQFLKTNLFSDKGLDPCSIYFDATKFNNQIEVVTDMEESDADMQCTSKLRNTTTSTIRAKATIVCDTSPAALESTLEFIKLSDDIDITPEDVWSDEDPGFDKVCIVILKRA